MSQVFNDAYVKEIRNQRERYRLDLRLKERALLALGVDPNSIPKDFEAPANTPAISFEEALSRK